jgi:hypothetical protein
MTDEVVCGFCHCPLATFNTADEKFIREELMEHLRHCPDNPHAEDTGIVETYAFLLTEAYRRAAEIRAKRAAVR